MFDSLKLSDLPKGQGTVLRRSSSTRPTVWHIEDNGIRAIVKDFSSNRFIFRNTVGRFLVRREAKAYKRLKNLKGVPALYRVIGGVALVIEEIPGIDLGTAKRRINLPDNFFDALIDLVESYHERGLAHCDLKRAGNILLGHDGRPYIIDWAAAIFETEFRFFPFNYIYMRFVLDDHNAITKRKLYYSPELVSEDEKRKYDHRNWFEKGLRTLRDRLRELLQKIV